MKPVFSDQAAGGKRRNLFGIPLTSERMVKIALSAALYAALTVAIAPLAYGAIQFRFSEVLVLLAFFSPDYIIGMTLGCLIANLFSPMALLDVPFGTAATLLSVIGIWKCRSLAESTGCFSQPRMGLCMALASLFPVICNGIIVGFELLVAFQEPLWFSMLTVALGEMAVVTVIGVPVFLTVSRIPSLLRLIGDRYMAAGGSRKQL